MSEGRDECGAVDQARAYMQQCGCGKGEESYRPKAKPGWG